MLFNSIYISTVIAYRPLVGPWASRGSGGVCYGGGGSDDIPPPRISRPGRSIRALGSLGERLGLALDHVIKIPEVSNTVTGSFSVFNPFLNRIDAIMELPPRHLPPNR